MQLEGLTVALRPRSPWEAADLGIALVRQHASRIWRAWILITLPVLVLLSEIGSLIGHVWLASLAMWWLKPLFDRIPLYILSRAVFGAAPGVRETLRAQWTWGWQGIWPWLLWRRLHPGRAMLLAVDLLEGLRGARRSERTRVLARASGSHSILLSVIGIHMEWMLSISIVVLGLLFVPIEFLSESAQQVWDTLLETPPLWAQFVGNLIGWIALSVIEPFYVGAGFGLYLNRRTQLEAWDIELAFRRMAARLAQPLAVLLLAVAMATLLPAPSPAYAASADEIEALDDDDEEETESSVADQVAGSAAEGIPATAAGSGGADAQRSLPGIFAGAYRKDDEAFTAAARSAYQDPDLNPKTTVQVWQRRVPLEDEKTPDSAAWLKPLGAVLSFIIENALWILLALLVVVLIRYHRVWLPWVSDRFERERTPDPVQLHEVAVPDRLPDDLPAAVRALWQQGKPRAALALFYRAGVARLAETLGVALPAGATEAECLRQARRLRESEYSELFVRIVRCWQAAAYAGRFPQSAEVESLLREWSDAGRPAT